MRDADRDAARSALVTLRTRVDEHFVRAATIAGDQMKCAAGCTQCCHVDLSVFQVEADPIRAALSALSVEVRARVRSQSEQTEHCAMLVDGRCAVYPQRPLICRSHGAAVQLDDGTVDHCPLNFAERAPQSDTVLRLTAINQPLSVMATLWDGAGKRVSLRSLAAEAD